MSLQSLRSWLALCLFALWTGCIVNPVPTPGPYEGRTDPTAQDIVYAGDAATDASVFPDTTISDATGLTDSDGAEDNAFDVTPATASDPLIASFLPKATDPAIDTALLPHVAMVKTSGLLPDRLLVHLSGTGGNPANAQLFLREAALLGHAALGLEYPNTPAVATICGDSTYCYESVRMEILDGVDRTDKVTITPANSIRNRLVKALQFLDKHDPGHGWGAFVVNGEPKWSAILISGHSQGGGHAAMIGKLHETAGVLMFASVVDSAKGQPAFWVTSSHATPLDRYFGFAHTQDPLFPAISANWTALGMGAKGQHIDVDKAAPPYLSARMLVTSLPSDHPHLAVVGDEATPLDGDGEPAYAQVWRHMIGL
jgi:hypothetical protein